VPYLPRKRPMRALRLPCALRRFNTGVCRVNARAPAPKPAPFSVHSARWVRLLITLSAACSGTAPATDSQGVGLPAAGASAVGSTRTAGAIPDAPTPAGEASSSTPSSSTPSSPNPVPKFEVTEPSQCESADSSEGLSLDGDWIVDGVPSEFTVSEVTELRGNLAIKQSPLPIELPRLQHIVGDLRMDAGAAESFVAPNLTRVDGDVWFYLNAATPDGVALRRVDLRNLKSVGGRVFIHRNASLTELQLDALSEVGGLFEISGNLKLPQCMLLPVVTRFGMSPESNGSASCTCERSCGVIRARCPAP
jgi:hypothetical protein